LPGSSTFAAAFRSQARGVARLPFGRRRAAVLGFGDKRIGWSLGKSGAKSRTERCEIESGVRNLDFDLAMVPSAYPIFGLI